MSVTVLAIESTLDETGAAVARLRPTGHETTAEQMAVEIISEVKASSADLHAKYGGVIPEIAAREQIAVMIPVITEAMEKSGVNEKEIGVIAVTEGPGMIGCLLIGVETAKALALAWKKPLIAVNHLAAHVFANWISSEGKVPEVPAVALIVSGGHTDIVLLSSLVDWKWLGGTRDDAAGEAFDKAARAMGFPYPGGPLVAKAAAEASSELPVEMKLPRPMIHEDNLEMSFSGLKTALIQVMERNKKRLSDDPGLIKALAKEFNQAVADVLITKTMKAVEQYQPKSVLLGGGVAANSMLREGLEKAAKAGGREFFCPDLKYCTDNAAMIAAAALLRPNYVDPLKLRPEPGLEVR